MELTYFDLIREIDQHESFEPAFIFELGKYCARLLAERETESDGRQLLIRLLDKRKEIPDVCNEYVNDLLDVAGLYPYMSSRLSGGAALRREIHRSRSMSDVFFHEKQLEVSMLLNEGRGVILSAPTSFGKSLLIQEMVASGKYRNIVVIQPTLALLDETRKKLKRLKGFDNYKLIISTTQVPSEDKGNIFLFTAERVLEYKNFMDVDFFVIDEFYKLSLTRDDDRAITLNQAFYKLLKKTNKYYLLGPVVSDLQSEFKSRLNPEWIHTNFATVAINEESIGDYKRTEEDIKRKDLSDLLGRIDGQTLIYCASPKRALDTAHEIYKSALDKGDVRRSDDLEYIVDWCQKNIHQAWKLNDLLVAGIAIHHGAIPRHLGSKIVDEFNAGRIKYLFCTATLIEGVNTSAKNVVLYDKKKGTANIDFFDFKNIAGRAGRMREHFIGNVYKMASEPKQEEFEVDAPIISQENAPDDILFFMDEADLLPSSKERIDKYKNIAPELLDILKANTGIPIDGQLSLLRELEERRNELYPQLNWRQSPSYSQLHAVIDLAWRHLMRKTDTKGGVKTSKQLAFLTSLYLSTKSIGGLIREWITIGNDVDEAIALCLSTSRTWFEYKLPRLLGCVSSLQDFAFEGRGGSYLFVATLIEHGFLPPNVSELSEYNLPSSLIRKISPHVGVSDSIDEVMVRLKKMDREKLGLIEYERRALDELLR